LSIILSYCFTLFTNTYAAFGEFRNFTLLFVTIKPERIETLRQALSDLPEELAAFYRLGIFDKVLADFLGQVWQSRLAADGELYRLTRN
jgi:hypothetical protein